MPFRGSAYRREVYKPAGCEHGMPSRASCVQCMYEGPVAPLVKPKLEAVKWIRARFGSPCGECGEWINDDDQIGLVEGVGWCCEGCAE